MTAREPSPAELRRKVFDYFVGLDRVLVPLGHRALAPAWRDALRRWLVDGTARTWVVRKGRRIGASTITCPRLILSWIVVVLPWLRLPPGEFITIGLVSIKRGESDNRLPQIAAIFDAVGIRYELRLSAGEIALLDMPVKVRVLTRNWKTAVGETIGLLWCDEVSRWEDDDSGANPADAVLGSLMPSLATVTASLCALVSSPWSEDDYHARRYDEGDGPHQSTAFLPTWIGNPTLSEEETHGLEPDAKTWAREYGAVPGATISQALDSEDVKEAFAGVLATGPLKFGNRYCAIDASSLRGDAFAWTYCFESHEFGLCIGGTNAIEGDELRRTSMLQVVDRIAEGCAQIRARTVFADQREEASLTALFGEKQLNFHSFAWSESSKDAAFQTFRRLLRERKIHFEPHATLQKEMLGCKAHLLPSGRVKYATNGLDYLSAVVTLLHAVNEGLINPNSDATSVPIIQPDADEGYGMFALLDSFASL